MITIDDKHNCCGCEACVQICPKHCITFDEDSEGFRYPSVNPTVCIECGLCEIVCPVRHQPDEKDPLTTYAAKNRNEEELLHSSSGGIFILLAKEVLRQGGVVFGAKFNEKWEVIHDYAETEEDVKFFMGSKYVQSRIGNTFNKCLFFLKQGRKVLFSGTPCQIAGLKRYLRKEYDNLLTVDVICHGVPSPKVWRKYIKEINENALQGENTDSSPIISSLSKRVTRLQGNDLKITGITFRDKRLGWEKYSFTLNLTETSIDGKKKDVEFSQVFTENPYMKLFLNNLTLRPSCYKCPAKGGKSQSDITIADFWGVKKSHPELHDSRGVGLLLINSEKEIETILEKTWMINKVSFCDAVASNSSFNCSAAEPPKRKDCFKIMDTTNYSFDGITKVLLRSSLFVRVRRKLSSALRKIF